MLIHAKVGTVTLPVDGLASVQLAVAGQAQPVIISAPRVIIKHFAMLEAGEEVTLSLTAGAPGGADPSPG